MGEQFREICSKYEIDSSRCILKEECLQFNEKRRSIANSLGLDRIYILKSSRKDLISAAIEEFNLLHNFEYAEPNFLYSICKMRYSLINPIIHGETIGRHIIA